MSTDRTPSLPIDDAQRGKFPMADGCLDYFPNALAEVSRISYEGNLKHNPGEPTHWARGKSTDHRNKIIRHTVDAVGEDEGGIEHAAQAAWRALAYLQEKIERVRGAPVSAGSRLPDSPPAVVDAERKVVALKLVKLADDGTFTDVDFTRGKTYPVTGMADSDGDYVIADDVGDTRYRQSGYNTRWGQTWEAIYG